MARARSFHKGVNDMNRYQVSDFAKLRHREVRAEQQQVLRAAAVAKAARQAQRPERRVRWAVRKVFRLRSAQD
jgi:hypothetical protein